MATQADIRLHPSWLARLSNEFEQPYMTELKRFLLSERERGKHIFPKASNWFRALDLTPLDKVRVVILGQDPYHGFGQAHGLCFSVQHGTDVPPSLANIYKELQRDLGIARPTHGCLTHWAEQGVLLLNAVLTVEEGRAGAHQGQGLKKSVTLIATNYRLQKGAGEDGQMQLPNIVSPAAVQKTVWGSPAGKKRLAAPAFSGVSI